MNICLQWVSCQVTLIFVIADCNSLSFLMCSRSQCHADQRMSLGGSQLKVIVPHRIKAGEEIVSPSPVAKRAVLLSSKLTCGGRGHTVRTNVILPAATWRQSSSVLSWNDNSVEKLAPCSQSVTLVYCNTNCALVFTLWFSCTTSNASAFFSWKAKQTCPFYYRVSSIYVVEHSIRCVFRCSIKAVHERTCDHFSVAEHASVRKSCNASALSPRSLYCSSQCAHAVRGSRIISSLTVLSEWHVVCIVLLI